jgi:hypothetical protein
MKPLREIRRSGYLRVKEATVNGGWGFIKLDDMVASVVWGTNESGWEHVSVSPYPETLIPTWDMMCQVKNLFWSEEEAAFQIHPPKSKYVNAMPNCLHLWRPVGGVHGMNPEWDEEGAR